MPAFSPLRLASCLLSTLVFPGPSHADIDLSGHWHTPQSTTGFAEIVHAGSDVTLTWTESGGPVSFAGTFDQIQVVAAAGTRQLRLVSAGGGSFLHGLNYVSGGLPFGRSFFSRCECFDGDLDDGDGCDSECRIEECYSCTGDPSVCVPSADAVPCNDRSDCTTGETCSAGSCGAGAPLSPCVYLSGSWRVNTEGFEYEFASPTNQPGSSRDFRFRQQDGVLVIYDEDAAPGDSPVAFGSIDAATGGMSYSVWGGSGLCTLSSSFEGTASGDSSSFAGDVDNFFPFRFSCDRIEGDYGTGTRCHPILGCDLTDCSGLVDGTPCEDGDVCTNRDSCLAGACAARFKCPACEACYDGYCDVGPRWNCAMSEARRSNQLTVSWAGFTGSDQFRWSWKKGSATAVESFGDPAVNNEMSLCIYNGDELLYRNIVSPDEACEEPPCWKEKGDRLSFKGSELSLSLRAGADGRAAISYKSSEALPSAFHLPLDPTLQVQFQIDNGACFQSYFDESSIKKNENGKFKATAPE